MYSHESIEIIRLGLGAGAIAGTNPERIWKLLTAAAIERVCVYGERSDLPGILGRHLQEVATVLWRPNGPIRFSREYNRERGGWIDVPVEDVFAVPTLYLYRSRPLLLSWFQKKNEDSGLFVSGCNLSFPRGAVNVDRLVLDAMKGCSQGHAIRHRVVSRYGKGFHGQPPAPEHHITTKTDAWGAAPIRYIGGRPQDFGLPEPAPAASWMWWSPEAQLLREDARAWLRGLVKSARRGLPGRRGWMLHGPPGNGKTLLACAIAEECDLPLYSLDLSAMTSRDYIEAWEQAAADGPSMVLIEDFDATIRRRENIRSREHGVAFETILNCLAGAKRYGGILFVMTTNDPAAVDPALCDLSESRSLDDDKPESRPGRIDISLEIGNPPRAGRLAIAERLLEAPDLARQVADASEGWSVAQVLDRCEKINRRRNS